MSGSNVPYQLRTNKFVERQLFLDILDFVRIWNGPSKYVYASMGGRFLEDFKLVNDRFAIEKMISIEMDETTSERQTFNRPFGFVECLCQCSEDFIRDFDRLEASCNGMRFIVWLDYAEANKRGNQLQEYQELLAKLASGDVAKITLNCNHKSYRRRSQFDIEADFRKFVIDNLQEQLGEYVPKGGISAQHLNPGAFAQLLAGSVKVAALKGVQGSDLHVVPLASYRYSDGEHQMLTVTAIVADHELKTRIESDDVFKRWSFRSREWDVVHEVNVPDLSPKERDVINGLISTKKDDEIHEGLPFRLDEKDDNSLELLKHYLQHYRRYPSFRRVQS